LPVYRLTDVHYECPAREEAAGERQKERERGGQRIQRYAN